MKKRYIWITSDFHDELECKNPLGNSVTEFNLEVHLSAYDIPKSVNGFRDERFFVVEFDYIDSEPLGKTITPNDSGISFVEGKHSGRLMQIKIDLAKFNIHDSQCIVNLQPSIIEAIDVRAGFHSENRDSFDAAKKVIKRNFAELVGTD